MGSAGKGGSPGQSRDRKQKIYPTDVPCSELLPAGSDIQAGFLLIERLAALQGSFLIGVLAEWSERWEPYAYAKIQRVSVSVIRPGLRS